MVEPFPEHLHQNNFSFFLIGFLPLLFPGCYLHEPLLGVLVLVGELVFLDLLVALDNVNYGFAESK